MEKGLSLPVRDSFADNGDVDSMEAGGVGIDPVSDGLVDAPGVGDLVGLASVFWPADDDEGDDSFCPHEARTLFSTLTVSSRNIRDNWSLYPGQALDSRTHCVHSGCLLSHCNSTVSCREHTPLVSKHHDKDQNIHCACQSKCAATNGASPIEHESLGEDPGVHC